MNGKSKLGFSDARTDFGTDRMEYTEDVNQHYPDTCAIRSQELILRDFGIFIPQDDLIAEAQANGWYNHGTPMEAVGNLLDAHGVATNRYENGNIFNLVNELAQGHKVIVGVDANELWGRAGVVHDFMEWCGHETPNHALVVSSIDTRDPDNVIVTLTDPGTGDVCKEYTQKEFEAAWADSNHVVIATREPAPPTVPGMENFDYSTGHIPEVMGMPFEDFASNFAHLGNLSVGNSMFIEGIRNLRNTVIDWFHGDKDEEEIPDSLPEDEISPEDEMNDDLEDTDNQDDVETDMDMDMDMDMDADMDMDMGDML